MQRGPAAGGVAPAGRVPGPSCPLFPLVSAACLARILLTLLLTAGESPLPCGTWSCITLMRTEEEMMAAQNGGRAWATLDSDRATAVNRRKDRGRPRVDGGAGRSKPVEGGGGGGKGRGGWRCGGGGGGAWGGAVPLPPPSCGSASSQNAAITSALMSHNP